MRGYATPVGFVAFWATMFYCGGALPLLIALVVSLLAGWLSRKVIFNKRLPVPSEGAVLITGASRGIGKETTLHLAKLGFHVLAGVRSTSDGKVLIDEGKENGKRIHPIRVDVSEEESILSAYEEVEELLETQGLSLVGVVNNAGYEEMGVLEFVQPQGARRQMDVNFFGALRITQVFLPLLRRNKTGHRSRLVFISSALGRFSVPLHGVYAASKMALDGLGDAFRGELKKFNIDVSILNVGKVNTSFFETQTKTRAANLSAAKQRVIHNLSDPKLSPESSPTSPSISPSASPPSSPLISRLQKSTLSTSTGLTSSTGALHLNHNSKTRVALEKWVAEAYETATEKVVAQQQATPPGGTVQGVVDCISNALLDSNPLPRYVVGKDALAAVLLFGLLPEGISDRLSDMWK